MARRQRGEGSVFKRASDGRWVGRLDLGNGKRRTIYGRTQADVVTKLRAARREAERGNLSTHGTTVEKWLTYWLEYVCRPKLKPKTLQTYRSYVDRHLIPVLGKKRLDRLTPDDVRGLHREMRDKVSATTVHHAHRILHTAINDALRDGKVTRNVVALVPAPLKSASPKDSLTLDQFAALMRHLDGDRLQSRWAFGLFTGARQGECLGLTWDNLDLTNGVADMAWQLQRIPYRHRCAKPCGRRPDRCPDRELDVQPGFEYRHLDGNLCLQRPKTKGSTRILPLPPMLLIALQERRALYLAERRNYRQDHGLVWTRPDGRPIDGRHDWADWSAMLAALGIPHMQQHAGRHTASTIMLALGVEESVRMAILGHSEAATNRLYSHVDLSVQRKAMETYDAAVAELLTR